MQFIVVWPVHRIHVATFDIGGRMYTQVSGLKILVCFTTPLRENLAFIIMYLHMPH